MSELRRITDDYRLDKLVRSGAAGSVFRATDLRSSETVAVKLILDEAGDFAEQRDAFLAAARNLQSLHHPNLPRVLDFGFTTAGSAFLVNEFFQGTGLETMDGSPPARVLALLEQAVAGLEAMAGQGIAHRNLRTDNLIVVDDTLKILGIGGAALGHAAAPADLEEGRREDLRAFATIACGLLGASLPADSAVPRVELPPAAAAALREPAALGALLATLLRQGSQPPPSYEEVRRALRLVVTGAGPGDNEAPKPAVFTGEETVFLPGHGGASAPSPPPLQPPPPPPVLEEKTAKLPRASARNPRLPLLAAGAAVGVVLLMALVFFLLREKPPEPSVAAPAAAAPSSAPAAVPESSPVPPPALSQTESAVTSALEPPRHESLAADLAAGLGSADLADLRTLVRSVGKEERADLPSKVRRDLDRAERALEADRQLTRAQKAGRQEEALRYAAALGTELPRSARAREARNAAAKAIEAESAAAVEGGRFDAALQGLESLRRAWPDRSGLAERIESAEAGKREDQRLEELLAQAAAEERANRPQEGLKLLAGAAPNRRFEERFQQAKARLETQVARLDRTPPAIAVRGTLAGEYEKDALIRVPLRITDDREVAGVELWVRPEGGRFEKRSLGHVPKSEDYVAEIGPGVHRNQTVELYVTATDKAGNQAQLASAEHPLQVKRKKKLLERLGDKVRPGKDDG